MYSSISLPKTLALYVATLAFFFMVLVIARQISPDASLFTQFTVIVITWASCGYYLNRALLHPLIDADHSMNATIHNQSSIKISCFVWWPIKYPELIVRIFFIRHM
jgi:hypothetical protein